MSKTTILKVGAIKDAAGVSHRPGGIIVRDQVIDQVGPWGEIRKERSEGEVLDLSRSVLLPPTVNAHTHLDLTNVGPRPYGGDFIEWIGMVMQTNTSAWDSIEQGWNDNWNNGTALIADIGRTSASNFVLRSPHSRRRRANSGWGVSFGELIGISMKSDEARSKGFTKLISHVERGKIDAGLQPHAPYSTAIDVYHAAIDEIEKYVQSQSAPPEGQHSKLDSITNPTRLSTHLAETPEEAQFVRDANGPFVDLLKKLNKWDGSFKPTGMSPVQYLEPVLKRAKWLVAHCNYVSDADIAILAKYGVSVAYCPIASDYFRHKNHRYRDMIDAGVNVCLGTDSIICQPAWSKKTLGIIAQVRFLYERDQADPELLLAMATTHGSKALGYVAAGPVMHGVGALGTLAHGAPAVFTRYEFDLDDPTDPWIQLLRDREYQGAVFEC